MGDFEAAVNQAFGQGSNPTPTPPPEPDPPPMGAGVDPFENDFHGRSPPRSPPRGGIKKKDRPPKEKRERRERSDRPPKKPKPVDAATKNEQKEKYEQIMRYVDTFPEHINNHEMMGVGPDAPVDHLTFVLQRIQQRINAKQELQVLQSGLVTMCMATEFGSSMIPKNPIKLKGFGTNVSSHISMFDDCLKQIACKYGGALQISVEAQISIMLVRCAVNTHLANVQLEKDEKLNLDHMMGGFPEDGVDGDGAPIQDPAGLSGGLDAAPPVPDEGLPGGGLF